MRLRGFNAARQDNGNVLINALIIFGVDAMSEDSKAEGIVRAQKELEYIVPYVQQNFVGFENAQLVGTASQLYVRESRHIIGEYQLTIDDVLENRDQWDKIAIVAYPADIQPTAGQTYGTVIGSPDYGHSVPVLSAAGCGKYAGDWPQHLLYIVGSRQRPGYSGRHGGRRSGRCGQCLFLNQSAELPRYERR